MNAVHVATSLAPAEPSMHLKDILATPLRATTRGRSWMALALFALCAAIGLAIALVIPEHKARFVATIVYAMGLACLWTMWLSGLLLLARDGRQLGVPRIVRVCNLAACVYALASVAIAVLPTVAIGGDAVLAALVTALATTGSLTFVLAPRWLSMWMGFVPAIYVGLYNAHYLPSPLDPRVQQWGWLVLAILAALVAIRWRQLLYGDSNEHRGWRSAMILQFRANAVSGDWSMDRQWAWRRPEGGRTEVDFRGVGPADPARAIRVVLGGWYVPQTPGQRLRAFARALLPMLLIIPAMWLVNLGNVRRLHALWAAAGVSLGLWLGFFCAAMLTVGTIAFLARRWRNHADMALLALLPGIGGNAADRHLVRAVSIHPAIGFVVAWLCVAVPLLLIHAGAMAVLLATLTIAGLAVLTATGVLLVFAGRPVGGFGKLASAAALIVLASASSILVLSGRQWGAAGYVLEWLTALGWLLFAAGAAWRTLRAWRVLRRRPHPFQANAA